MHYPVFLFLSPFQQALSVTTHIDMTILKGCAARPWYTIQYRVMLSGNHISAYCADQSNTTAPLGHLAAIRTATNHVFEVGNPAPDDSKPYVAL